MKWMYHWCFNYLYLTERVPLISAAFIFFLSSKIILYSVQMTKLPLNHSTLPGDVQSQKGQDLSKGGYMLWISKEQYYYRQGLARNIFKRIESDLSTQTALWHCIWQTWVITRVSSFTIAVILYVILSMFLHLSLYLFIFFFSLCLVVWYSSIWDSY